jgi:PAS domain-containing protein
VRHQFGNQSPKESGVFIAWVIPLAVPFALWAIEFYTFPVSFLMPLVLVVLLCFLALHLPPSSVLSWTIVYAAMIILLAQVSVEPPPTSPALRPYVRSGFIFVGGITALLLAAHRVRMHKGNQALFKVISALPTAVIVSDVSGNILLMNDKCRTLLTGQLTEFSGLSFFSAFTAPHHQGREIEKYVSYFDREDGGPHTAVLRTRGAQPLVLNVVLTVVTLDHTRYAVTVIEKIAQEAWLGVGSAV